MSLISKQIDELRGYAKGRKGELAKLINDAAFTIELLSAKQPEPHWIPCSVRLPEFKYETYDDYDDYTFWDTDFVIGATSRGTLSIGQFTRDSDKPNEYHWDACECDAFDLQGCLRIGDHIIAWMPLPEPYKEGEGC